MDIKNYQDFAPGKGRGSKKIPDPFQRPSIDLGGGPKVKKDWQWINANELSEGDIIAGEGVVLEIKTQFQYGDEWRMYIRTPKHEHGTIVDAFKKYYTFSPVKKSED
jgi:hypothetical protein